MQPSMSIASGAAAALKHGQGYRPEIDGLRALAVVGVVLFHAHMGLHGGFVGVDVFFVISGFLITKIIQNAIDAGTFSMASFWVRRIRRIMPAALAMVLVVLLAGLLLLDPVTMIALARSGLAQALVYANIFYWRDVDYFAQSADLKPLLHSWSLAVEEQFYLFLPLLLVVIARYRRSWLKPALVLMFAGSFAVSVYLTATHRSAAFYLLPSRAWQMLAGSLLALYVDQLRLPRWAAQGLSIGGLLAVVVAMCVYTMDTAWPGVAAALPVLGAVAFIAGTTGQATLAGRLLSLPPIVFVGLISYSLYLWHWPIFVFARLCLIEVTPWTYAVLIVASFAAAALSWKFVEGPFRTGPLLKTRRSAFAFGGLATASTVLLCTVVLMGDGLPQRVDERYTAMLNDVNGKGWTFKPHRGAPTAIGARAEPYDNVADAEFVVWGDSHSYVLMDLMSELAQRRGVKGVAHVSFGLPPVTDLWFEGSSPAQRQEMLETSERRLQMILASKARHVVLVGRWSLYLNGYSQTEREEAPPGGLPVRTVTDADVAVATASADEHREVLTRRLAAMVQRLREAGIQTWIIQQVPEADNTQIAREFYLSRRYAWINGPVQTQSVTADQSRARRADADRMFEDLSRMGAHVVDPHEAFFVGSDRLVISGDRAYYRDNNHLTSSGVDRYMRTSLSPMFDAIGDDIRLARVPGVEDTR